MNKESRPFSIGAWKQGEFKDDNLAPERLAEMQFTSEDAITYRRGEMEYNIQSGDISYGGRAIVNGCFAASQLAGLFKTIIG